MIERSTVLCLQSCERKVLMNYSISSVLYGWIYSVFSQNRELGGAWRRLRTEQKSSGPKKQFVTDLVHRICGLWGKVFVCLFFNPNTG